MIFRNLFLLIAVTLAANINDDISFDDGDEISVTKWSANNLTRPKRQVEGSGETGSDDDDDDYYEDYSEEEDEAPEGKPILDLVSPVFDLPSVTPTVNVVEPSPVVIEPSSAFPEQRGHSGDGPVLEEEEEITPSTIQSTIAAKVVTTEATPTLPPLPPPNSPPVVQKRLEKLAVNAGSVFVYEIPSETFRDFEDGDSRLLRLVLKTEDDSVLNEDSWIGFDPIKQSISAMPLDKDIGKYKFILEATDSSGAKAKEIVDFVVRQDPVSRTFHHKFVMRFTVDPDSTEGFNKEHDLLLHTIKQITKYFDTQEPIGKHMYIHDYSFEPLSLTWTNRSLNRQMCPADEIEDIMEMIIDVDGEVVPELEELMAPQLHLNSANVVYFGVCQTVGTTTRAPENTPPEKRNEVDEIKIVAGELLRYQVPDDTFYDPQDGGTRNLKLSLQTMDRDPLDHSNWLQFDVANQEFYGVPLLKDAGKSEYLLVCTDSQGLSVVDSMIVVVEERPIDERFNVEFSINLDVPYEDFSRNAHGKVRFIETLARAFGDANTSSIVLKSLKKSTPDFHESMGQTSITWLNKTLSYDPCPYEEIEVLRSVLLKNDGHLTKNFSDIFFNQEFTPLSASLKPTYTCLGMTTPTYRGIPVDESTEDPPEGPVGSLVEDYLFTFIVPGLIIAGMLIIAFIIACVLYRRQRSGKMYIEEHQTFISKGIPVIFAEELDDKQEPPAKLILRDEMRATLPPGYKRSGTPKHSSVSPTPEQRELLPRNGASDRYPTFKAL
ncbi:dystroglycan 1-like [Artemia franciscana]|uniref:Dystroglycan 1 n=1 Tax=Artemia franciscana TaxID=6661 RepID=A0AA88I3J6_ARTSF|nr:hypothetical protein QYM36_004848 [Artemia franciscana]